MKFSSLDTKFMKQAISLARRANGYSAPNPAVGCVITNFQQKAIAVGMTAKGGRPHAEAAAMAKLTPQQKFDIDTIYVTLEPCSYYGMSPACTELLIDAKPKRVIISSLDPNPKVNGKGILKIRNSGIKVYCGLLKEEAIKINRGFFNRMKTGMPLLDIKIASTFDAKISMTNYTSKWITSQKSRDYAKTKRRYYDAILIGHNTLIKDNPGLNASTKNIIKIIIANSPIKKDLNIFDEYARVWLITNMIAYKDDRFERVIYIPKIENTYIDPKKILQELGKLNINSILLEGGARTVTAFIKARCFSKIYWYKSLSVMGNGIQAIGDIGVNEIFNLPKLKLLRLKKIANNILFVMENRKVV